MGQQRLNDLILLFVHKDIPLDVEVVIDRFAGMKPRRMALTNALTATDAVWTAIMSVSVDIELIHVLCRTLLLKLF